MDQWRMQHWRTRRSLAGIDFEVRGGRKVVRRKLSFNDDSDDGGDNILCCSAADSFALNVYSYIDVFTRTSRVVILWLLDASAGPIEPYLQHLQQ